MTLTNKMAEMDPIVKTVYIVIIAVAIFIVVLIGVTKNNPVFAQVLLNAIDKTTDTIIEYKNTMLMLTRKFY
jgi:hypothetical protein